MMTRAQVTVHLVVTGIAAAGLLFGRPTAAQQAAAAQGPAANDTIALRDAPVTADALAAALAPRSGGLTAEEAARRAVAASPSLDAKTAEIDAAAAQLDQAMASFLPRLTLRASYTRLSPVESSLGGDGAIVGVTTPGALTVGPCPGGGGGQCLLDSGGLPAGAFTLSIDTPLDNYALTASLSVPVSDYLFRLRSTRKAATLQQNAAILSKEAEATSVATQAKVAFYNWARAIGQVAVSEKSVERAKARLADVQTTFALGTATKADALRLEALVANSESLVAQARALRDLAYQQLRMLMNDSGKPRDLGEDVLQPDPRLPASESLDPLVAEAMSRRLEIKALSESAGALSESAAATRAGMFPRLEALGDVTYANPNQRSFSGTEWKASWSVGAAITWTINDVFAGSASASGLEANARGVLANQTAAKNAIRLEVTMAYLDRKKAEVALDAATRSSIASQEAYRVATDLYRVGKATTTEVIDVESELVASQLQLLNAHIDLKLARFQLAHAVGRDLPKGS